MSSQYPWPPRAPPTIDGIAARSREDRGGGLSVSGAAAVGCHCERYSFWNTANDDMSIFLFGLAVLSVIYWIWAFGSVDRLRRCQAACLPHTPPVSILKPVRNDDGQLYANLRSFCEQDYPQYEILFGVASLDDPAVSVI